MRIEYCNKTISFNNFSLPTNLKPKINVSLRGGTTKQPVSFRRIFFIKFIEIVQLFHSSRLLGERP
jgi:hypothetical protein